MRLSLKPFFCRIKTKGEYRASVKKLSDMVDRGDALTKAENDYLDLLATLVEDYERRMCPEVYEEIQTPVSPVEAIAWAMDKQGLKQKDLCPYIGSEPLVSAVMKGTRALSKSMIVRLHEGLGIAYEDLLSHEAAKTAYRKVAML